MLHRLNQACFCHKHHLYQLVETGMLGGPFHAMSSRFFTLAECSGQDTFSLEVSMDDTGVDRR